LLSETELIEALHRERLSRLNALLVILCVEPDKPKEVNEIKHLGRGAGLTEIFGWNVSDVLGRAKKLAIRLPAGWAITSAGRDHVISLGSIPAKKSAKILHVASSLRHATKRITHADTIAFLDEAITAFESGLNRAAVVLSWVGAMSVLQEEVFAKHLSSFNTEARRKYSDWKHAKTKDDLSRIKETDFLDIIGSPPVSILGKSVKEELKNCLRLRNGCGHPNSLSIGDNRVAAHIEVLILNVFAKF
jgi:hypothetical protein